MAIQWGGWAGNMRVGIDVWTDAYDTNTPTINVTAAFYVQCALNFNFSDQQRLYLGGVFEGQGFDFFNNLGAGEIRHIGNAYIWNQAQRYEGGPTWAIGAAISGHYQGASPSAGIWFTLPARPPNVPTQPGVWVSEVGVSTAKVNVEAANGRGAGIDAYEVAVSLPGPTWTETWHQSWDRGTGYATNLLPNTVYEAGARAHNGVGWGQWAFSGHFRTGSTVPSTPPSAPVASDIGQTSVKLTWSLSANNGGSPVSNYEVQIATNSGFTTGIKTYLFGNVNNATLTDLTPGQAYWARVRARNGVGYSGYTSVRSFTTLAGTPSIVSPAVGAALSDGRAAVTVAAGGVGSHTTITVELSQSSTFASGIKTLTLTPASSSGSGQYTLENTAEYLKSGTWYARARVRNNTTSYVTPWSQTISFTQSHQPSASLKTPTGGQTLRFTTAPSLEWEVNDASPIDMQTAYRVVVEHNSTGEVFFDSGKVVSTSKSVVLTVTSALKNVGLRWRVMVWDRGDTASAWTGYGLFTLSDPPNVTVLSPDPIIPVDNGAPTFRWSVAIPSGGVQTRAVISVFDSANNSLVWTETVEGAATEVTPSVVILRNEADYYWTVEVTDSTLLTGVTQSSFSTEYTAPATVTYEIDGSDVDELGYVAINWSNANPDPLFAAWKVYRRTLASQWELIATITNQNVRNYRDYMLVAGDSYSYSVTQVATRSGSLLESSVGYYYNSSGEETAEHRYFSIDLTHYWIINSDKPELSIRLAGVVEDSSVLEYESASYTIVGRGRHVDYGDRLGYKGSLKFQIRDVLRPSPIRLQIEALRDAQETYHLRTPFGRLFQIALGNPDWSPIAGVGIAEMGDMTIPYEEVA